jgi:hypothetical protein
MLRSRETRLYVANTPISPVKSFIEKTGGAVTTADTDHLGTLLDYRKDMLCWLTAE